MKNDKVAEKREKKIKEAAIAENWDEVSKLLAQPLANAERRDREYGLLSTNKLIGTSKQTEFGDTLTDKVLNPLDLLIQKEENAEQVNINDVLHTLSEIDLQILTAYVLESKSFSKISKETEMSDKTVKKHFITTIQTLKTLLE